MSLSDEEKFVKQFDDEKAEKAFVMSQSQNRGSSRQMKNSACNDDNKDETDQENNDWDVPDLRLAGSKKKSSYDGHKTSPEVQANLNYERNGSGKRARANINVNVQLDNEKLSARRANSGKMFECGEKANQMSFESSEKNVKDLTPSSVSSDHSIESSDGSNYKMKQAKTQGFVLHQLPAQNGQRGSYQRKIASKRTSIMKGIKQPKRAMSFIASDPSEFKKALENALAEKKEEEKKNFSYDDNFADFSDMDFNAGEQATTVGGEKPSNFLTRPMDNLQTFTMFAQMPLAMSTAPSCIILPSSKMKLVWDIFILMALLFVSILVPFRLAFYPEDDFTTQIIYIFLDSCFFLDIIVTFFSATMDAKSNIVQTDKKELAKQYLKFWFWIDVFAILPLDAIMKSGDANILIRFAKIGKLYKLIRLSRLAKLFKLLKGSNAVFSQLSSSMMLSSGVERLVFIGIFGTFFLHISSCLFIFLSDFDEDTDNIWRFSEPYLYYDIFDLYVTALYYVITTMSTVGYGDISGGTAAERIFCIMLMLTGVLSFNLISGALGALITNYDSSQAALQEKLLQLNNLKVKYKINDELYFQIKKALQYDHSANMTGLDIFISGLPDKLRLDISEEMQKKNFDKFTLFSSIGGKNFLAWVASKLRPRYETENVQMYEKGDNIDCFFFGIKGIYAYVIPEQRNAIFGIVDPGRVNMQKSRHKRLMQYFGCEDSIINNAARVHDNVKFDDCFQFSNNGIKDLRKRFFSVLSVTHTESLTFNFADIDQMKRDFPFSSKEFFKLMMQQTKKLLVFCLLTFQNIDTAQRLLVKRDTLEKNKHLDQGEPFKSLEQRNLDSVYTYMRETHIDVLDEYSELMFSDDPSSSLESVEHSSKDEDSESSESHPKSAKSETPFEEFHTPRNMRAKSMGASLNTATKNASPFLGLSHGQKSEPDPNLSDFTLSPLKQLRGISPPAGKRSRNMTEVRKNQAEKPIELRPFAMHDQMSSDKKIGSPEKVQDYAATNQHGTEKHNANILSMSHAQRKTPEDKQFKRRQSQYLPKNESLFLQKLQEVDNSEKTETDGDSSPKRHRHKLYDQAARAKFKRKMQKKLTKEGLTGGSPDVKLTQSGKQPKLLASTGNLQSEIHLSQLQDKKFDKNNNAGLGSSHINTHEVPDLLFGKINQDSKNKAAADDQDDNDASSEHRDAVVSLRESKQPVMVNAKSSGLFGQLSGNQTAILANQDEKKTKQQSSVKAAAVMRRGSLGHPFLKKETEFEFTRRLHKENPRGMKGLAYVLMEIRRAISEGIIKPKVQPHADGKGINKFADMFNKVASTRLRATERLTEMLATIKDNKSRILDHVLKEQDFNNEEPIIEKNEIFLDRMVKNQRRDFDLFFSKLDGKMNVMASEISHIKEKVDAQQVKVETLIQSSN